MTEKEIFIPRKRNFQSLAGIKNGKDEKFQAQCNLPCRNVCSSCSCHVVKAKNPGISYRFD
ncbi:MAG: hypothetical protein ABH919_03910 [bacterium]